MPTNGAPERPSADNDRYEELRSLLLGPERELLGSLRERVENPKRRTEDVAGVLADAIRLRPDAKLRRALQPLVAESLQLSVRTNPRMLAEALFPIFGQAIRKSINAELAQMLEALSQSLEQKVSLRSLQWRFEAIRTRKPYAEIVLLRSLLYRIEQVFLIHRPTGLLLGHIASPDVEVKDPESVSGMLTAIQDFVHDSIHGTDGDNLDMIRMGDVGVVLAYTNEAILCGFVRGVPPRSLSRLFQDKLEEIVERKSEALRNFSGDTVEFESCRPQLQACLVGQGSNRAKRSARLAQILLFGVPLVLIAALAAWWIHSLVIGRRFSNLVDQVSAQPGIVVTHVEQRGGRFKVAGLKDPLAADPASLVAASGLPAGKVDFAWQDYHSLTPTFANQRTYSELKAELARRSFRFGIGVAEIPPEQRFLLEDVATQILSLLRAGRVLGKIPLVVVVGNHDPAGTEQVNASLAKARANNVRTALISMGLPAASLGAAPADRDREACSAVKAEERLECRSAVFVVTEVQTRAK